jgi:hypothetical protein
VTLQRPDGVSERLQAATALDERLGVDAVDTVTAAIRDNLPVAEKAHPMAGVGFGVTPEVRGAAALEQSRSHSWRSSSR